jgi:hypothetical protein
MPPIDPGKAENILTDITVAQKVYGQVKEQVYSGIAQLQEEQKVDPKHSLPSRCAPQIPMASPNATSTVCRCVSAFRVVCLKVGGGGGGPKGFNYLLQIEKDTPEKLITVCVCVCVGLCVSGYGGCAYEFQRLIIAVTY